MKKLKNNSLYHTPVLLKEAIEALQISKGSRYIDGTLGGGGHTEAILDKGGRVLGIDKDEDAVKEVKERFKDNKNLIIVKGNFKDIEKIARENGFEEVSGILLDLGTSVHQLKDSKRGFSFNEHERLDMRMDKSQNSSAYEIVNAWSKADLIDIFERYGEESEAKKIAEEIIKVRKTKDIAYADELSEIIKKVKKSNEPGINPATKVFQAIRIAVNDELNAIKKTLDDGISVLGGNGRFVIISFHSLEDRIVKQKFIELERKGMGRIITKKAIQASFEEVEENKKSRSAKMRVFEKN